MADRRDRPEGFVGRWARLKAETRAEEATRVVPPVEPALSPAVEGEALAPQASAEAALPTREDAPETAAPEKVELPPVETLTRESDFSLFMRSDVSADLRTQALRRLWSLDPHFATIDISECHSIDFNAVPTFPEGLKNTIYRIGSGMVEAVEEIERKEAEKAKLAAALPSESTPDEPPVPAKAEGDPEV